jgi:hypothetical protein
MHAFRENLNEMCLSYDVNDLKGEETEGGKKRISENKEKIESHGISERFYWRGGHYFVTRSPGFTRSSFR